MVEYKYDDTGRLVRKSVVNNPKDPNSEHYNSDYTYDGMGRLVRERIYRWDAASERMIVTQDKITTFDLGSNPTEIKFYDSSDWAYTETRTFARSYQNTDTAVTGLTQ
ncbi:MAG: hypothetical protein GY869_13840 [Planctomycetes bacterium]|nr:hypothetical protein [Planctomycetota bacterium]